ncbi:hypothetical protein [Lederbergia lenta]|nr:hypothetical protein [Lederbergia lenta]
MGRISKVIRVAIKVAPIVYPVAKKILNNRKGKKSSNHKPNTQN